MNKKETNFDVGNPVKLIYDWKSGAGTKFGVYKAGSCGTVYAIGETSAFCQVKMDDGKIIQVNAYKEIEIISRGPFNIGDIVRLIYDWQSGAGAKYGIYKAGSLGTVYAIGETTAFCQIKMEDGKIVEVNAYEDIELVNLGRNRNIGLMR